MDEEVQYWLMRLSFAAIIFAAGAFAGSCIEKYLWQRGAVKAGAGRYNSETGYFEFKVVNDA